MVQNSVRTSNPENRLIWIFQILKTGSVLKMRFFFKKRTRAILKTCPKNLFLKQEAHLDQAFYLVGNIDEATAKAATLQVES